jgi:hypothetical protein
MSNSSIAAYPRAIGQRCVEYIQGQHPEWRVLLNAAKFVHGVNVFIVENEKATLVWMRFPSMEDYGLYKAIAALLPCPWLHVMFQEHVVWEYNLYDERNMLTDRFEPLPSMWGHDRPLMGNAETLAGLWDIKAARIQRYLKPWDKRLRGRKAYLCRDRWRFGQFEQGYDFVEALSGLRLPE